MATEYLSSTDTLGTWKTKINNTIGKIDAIGDTSLTKTSTIGTTWVGSESPYTQTISISDITLASIVEITLPSTATKEQIEAFQALNWTDGGQTNNSITLKAWGDRNTIEIPIIVIIRN